MAGKGDFAGLSPEEGAKRLVDLNARQVKMRESTRGNKEMLVRKVLRALAERGLDFASVESSHMEEYRDYLADLAEEGEISQDYAAGIVRAWNSTARAILGTGELNMKRFREKPKGGERLSEGEIERMFRMIPEKPFLNEHYRNAFVTWMKVVWCAGARVGSLFDEEMLVRDIDWQQGTLRLRHMKNMDEPHTVVLNKRALLALKDWVAHLRTLPLWRGIDTPVFVAPSGRPLTTQWCNRTLKGLAALARVDKIVTTHVLRKSVGTLIARTNPRYAMEQLGISPEIFERHYNLPTIEDRVSQRGLLPGSGWVPRTPEEIAGAAILDLDKGRIDPSEFEERLGEARKLRALPDGGGVVDPAYG